MLVTGGLGDQNNFLNQTFVISLDTNKVTVLPSMQMARAQHGCATAERGYVVAGGYGEGGRVLDTVEMFTSATTPETGSWQTLGSLPQPRYYLSAVYSFGHLIIAGGQTTEREYPALPVLEYLWGERNWTQWEGYSTTRHKHVTVVMD